MPESDRSLTVIAACIILLTASWLLLYHASDPLPEHSPSQWVRQAP